MHGFNLFLLGCFLGAFIGVAVMCLLQASRINEFEMSDRKEDDTDEKKN